jgi:hypothetical protein
LRSEMTRQLPELRADAAPAAAGRT